MSYLDMDELSGSACASPLIYLTGVLRDIASTLRSLIPGAQITLMLEQTYLRQRETDKAWLFVQPLW